MFKAKNLAFEQINLEIFFVINPCPKSETMTRSKFLITFLFFYTKLLLDYYLTFHH